MSDSVLDVIRRQLSEKITVYVDEDTQLALKRDCENFLVENMNSFINRLVKNYISAYYNSVYDSVPAIKKTLSESFPGHTNDEYESAAKQIAFTKADNYVSSGQLNKTINFRLNKYVVHLAVGELYSAPASLEISKFFRQMFLSYLSSPIYKREHIIYAEELETIQTAIREKKIVSYMNKSNGKTRVFAPYSIEKSSLELHNYVIAQMGSEERHITSIRLANLSHLTVLRDKAQFRDDFGIMHDAIKRNGVQFGYDSIVERSVRLNEEQYRTYERRYVDRPAPIKEEHADGIHTLYFDCSNFHLRSYFEPFGTIVPLIQDLIE